MTSEKPTSTSEAEAAPSERKRTWSQALLHRPAFLLKSRWRRFMVRLFAWGLIAACASVLVVYASVRMMVTPTMLRRLLIQQAAEQTGGMLDVGRVEFDLWHGIQIQDIALFPPLPGDTRGSLYGGAVTSMPIVKLAALKIRYNARKLLAGRVHIEALQLVSPEVNLVQNDGKFNFEAITNYRDSHFPLDQTAAKPQPSKDEKAEGDEGILPFNPKLLFLPFDLLVQNIGIQNLSISFEKTDKHRKEQGVSLHGLSVDLGLHWHGNESSIWLASLSPFENPLTVKMAKAEGGQMKPALTLSSALGLRLEVVNLNKVNFDFATRVMDLATPAAGYKGLGATIKMRLGLTSDLKGVNIDTATVQVADALAYELAGLVSVQDKSFAMINLKLKQKLEIQLASAAQLASPFLPGIKASGEIAVDELKIDGSIERAKLATAAKGIALPHVSGIVWLREVSANIPGLGIDMLPVNGAVSLAAGPSMTPNGSQVDLSVDLKVPKVLSKRTTPIGEVTGGIYGLIAKVTARVLWPEMVLPILKVNIEAARVIASGQHIAKVDVPLYVDITAEGRQDLERAALSANLELTGLTGLSVMADCQDSCSRFRSNIQARLDSLAKIHAIMLPLAGVLNLGDFMPTSLAGTVDWDMSARGRMPNPLKTPTAEILKQADVQFNTQLELGKLSVKMPFDQVDLRNAETRLQATGTLVDQKIDFAQKFDGLTMAIVKNPDEPVMPIGIKRLSFETTINNQIHGPLDIAAIPALLHGLTTDLDTKLFVGNVTVAGTLPRPLSDVQFGATLKQQHLSDISVQDLTLRVPDFGTNVSFNANTSVGPNYLPKRLDFKLSAQVIHSGDEKLPAGVKTSGRVDLQLAATTEDMHNIAVDGQATFDKFNVLIPGKGPKDPPTLIVEGIQGQIPFKQVVLLPDLSLAKKVELATGEAVSEAKPVEKTSKTVPQVEMRDEEGKGSVADATLTHAMNAYLEKNDTKLPADTNIVAMVDFGTIRPFYPERQPLSIKRVEVANLEMSNMEFDMELRQSWFALNQFVINFLGGKIEGDFQLAFDGNAKDVKDMPKSLRTSLHLTRLDSRKLLERFPSLKSQASSWDLFSNPYIDATIHLQIDVKSSDISGDVEISSIGKEQLRMLLFYVDPYEQNPTIGDIRTALNVGEVRRVSIPLKNGEVGLDVDVRLLEAPIPLPKLSRFPIGQILQNFKDQAKAG